MHMCGPARVVNITPGLCLSARFAGIRKWKMVNGKQVCMNAGINVTCVAAVE